MPENTSKPVKRGVNPWRDILTFVLNPENIKTIFDVGANEGQTSEAVLKFFPHSSIHAFEPMASTYETLLKNTAGRDMITCCNVGLSDRSGSRRMFVQDSNVLSSVEENIDRGLGAVDVTMETLSDYCSRSEINTIDILKTDTEGHDLHVLRGGEDLLAEGRVSFIYSEVGFHEADRRHTNFCRLLDFLHGHDFQFLGLYEQGFLVHLDHPEEPFYGFTNALFGRNVILNERFGEEYRKHLAKQRDPTT